LREQRLVGVDADRVVRPARLLVHLLASGQTAQARPKRASPPPARRGMIATGAWPGR
jgi:hypothetical protein